VAWQEGLDDRQIEAAAHAGSHARLLAGPGTGKTVTLTRRIARLILHEGVPPGSILAVAFTRINAFDLRRTLEQQLEGSGLAVPRVSTLHSYALRQLLRNAGLITTLPQPLRIADDFEEKTIIRQDLRLVLTLTDRQIRGKFADLSSDWESLAIEQPDYQPADPQFMGAWQRHRNLYGYTLRSELIWQLKHAFEENPDNFAFEGNIRHLVVDEYQDLNRCDLAIVRKFADLGAEVYCAGDDDQSIYGFRRAHPAGIRQFPNEYNPSSLLELDTCWRSETSIIQLGQHIANQDPARLPKPLRPRDGAGAGQVHLLRFGDQLEEASGVALICSHLIGALGFAPDDIIVLLRSDHQGRYSETLADEFRIRDLPHSVRAESGDLLDQLPGRLILTLLRLSVNPNDDLAWRTVFHFCGRNNQIGASTIAAIEAFAGANGMRFHAASNRIKEDPSLIERGSFVQREIEEVLVLVAGLAPLEQPDPDAIETVEGAARARQEVLKAILAVCETVIPDQTIRHAILSHILDRAIKSGAITPGTLLGSLTSPEDTLDQELDDGKINILTMHRAKGLSARAVIVIAAEEQLIPGDSVGDDFDDARRLLYVSLTRAKEYLWVSYCNRRTGRQRHSGSNPGVARRTLSPFLRGSLPVESGQEYLQQLGLLP
jgi:DNA helicase-2/ATP-dependent DNA helicase PcrA